MTLSSSPFEKPSANLSVSLYSALESEIVDGRIQPGAHLVERTLCDRFKVSRAVVRESILRLERYGLVRVASRGGATVTELTRDGFIDAYYFREALEVVAAEQCAQRMNRQQIRELQEAADRISEEYEKERNRKTSELRQVDQAFHRAIVEGSGNTHIRNAWFTAMLHFFRAFKLTPEHLLTGKTRQAILVDHHAIASAISEGDGEAAGRAMKKHIQAGRELILKYGGDAMQIPMN